MVNNPRPSNPWIVSSLKAMKDNTFSVVQKSTAKMIRYTPPAKVGR